MNEKTIFHNGNYYTKEQMKDIVLKYYHDCFKQKYDRHVRMQQLFPSDIPQNSRILDFGCGMGGITDLLSRYYASKEAIVDGVDIDEDQIEKAKCAFSDSPRCKFLLTRDFAYPENAYDLVFSSQVIEHVHNVGNYLSSISKVLKDSNNGGGYLLIGVPNVTTPWFFAQTLFFSNSVGKNSLKILSEIITNLTIILTLGIRLHSLLFWLL